MAVGYPQQAPLWWKVGTARSFYTEQKEGLEEGKEDTYM